MNSLILLDFQRLLPLQNAIDSDFPFHRSSRRDHLYLIVQPPEYRPIPRTDMLRKLVEGHLQRDLDCDELIHGLSFASWRVVVAIAKKPDFKSFAGLCEEDVVAEGNWLFIEDIVALRSRQVSA